MKLFKTIISNWRFWILLAIIVLGAGLRLYGLRIQSLWLDELAGWNLSHSSTWAQVIQNVDKGDISPPGYHLVNFLLERFVGDDEVILRLPSAIAGIFSIIAIYFLGKQLYSPKEGLLSAVMLAVLWCPVYYSQEERPYSTLVLFVLISTILIIQLVKKLFRPQGRLLPTAILYIVSATIVCYLHYFGLFLIFLQGVSVIIITLFLRKFKATLLATGVYSAIFILFMPWFFHFKSSLGFRNGWISAPTYRFFWDYLVFLFNNSPAITYLVVILFSFLIAYTAYLLIKRRTRSEISLNSTLFLILWLVLPIGLIFLASLLIRPMLVDRYLLISMPAAYILLARAIFLIPLPKLFTTLVAVGLVGLLLYHLIFQMQYYTLQTKEQWRQAVQLVVQHEPLPENSKIYGCKWRSFWNYYFQHLNSSLQVEGIACTSADLPQFASTIETNPPSHIWLLSAHMVPDTSTLDYLEKNYTLDQHYALIGAQVWYFSLK
jgi:uncharacterized membrane protein